MDLPYKAEYAKSGRASCKGCKSPIAQGTLRLAVLVQSPFFDGKQAHWYHQTCFFAKQRPNSVDDIENFQSLRLPDQDTLKEKIAAAASMVVPDTKKKGKKRDATESAAQKAALKDYKIEYAKSSRAHCRGCEQKIMKGEVRAAKIDFQSDAGKKFGGEPLWHHLTCFAKCRTELGYFESAEILPGFKSLNKEDKAQAKKQLPAIKQEDVPEIKKPKLEDEVDGLSKKEEKEYQKQNKIYYTYREELMKLTRTELTQFVEKIGQVPVIGVDNMSDLLADLMTFGNLMPCKACKEPALRFNGQTYMCNGDLTEWTKCTNSTDKPDRKRFVVPKFIKSKPFFEDYKYVPRTRVIKKRTTSSQSHTMNVKKEDEDAGPKVERELPPLYDMQFVILGNPQRGKDNLKTQIVKLGGRVVTKISKDIMAVISNPAEVEKMGSRMLQAQEEDIHVVSEDFVDEAKDNVKQIPELVVKKTICNWGSDPNTRLPPEPSKSGKSMSKFGSYTKSVPTKIKLKLKGGLAVDPDSGLEHSAHVFVDGDDKYTCVLGLTDIAKNKNSYYKLQLLEGDHGNRYWLFRSWGRIGTTIGGNKTEGMTSLYEAKKAFCFNYEDKTGNMWENRHDFQKLPGHMYPIDVDYDTTDNAQEEDLSITSAPSKLDLPVQNLMKLIFDVKSMEKVMAELELDTEKMPLGKLSKAQIQHAYGVLADIQKLINKKETNHNQYVDLSNRFYTLIPHSFGIHEPIILQDEELVKQKLDMLENLLEMEIAYTLMRSTGSKHTVDTYYEQLKTEITALSTDSDEYKFIQEYVKNTHAETHRSYELEIEDVFVVKRQGEEKRYKPFRKLPNRKLLWHGSRTTNFAGILSQGLRIAPPEAPVTGYMFGKGIYFADMVSKSANYCCTSPASPNGLLLLCEVALGDMYERNKADYIEKLPKGKHSTKGMGATFPDPSESKIVDGVEVPCGQPITNAVVSSSLLYNEYIVYDIAQVNVKYLVKTNFKYKF